MLSRSFFWVESASSFSNSCFMLMVRDSGTASPTIIFEQSFIISTLLSMTVLDIDSKFIARRSSFGLWINPFPGINVEETNRRNRSDIWIVHVLRTVRKADNYFDNYCCLPNSLSFSRYWTYPYPYWKKRNMLRPCNPKLELKQKLELKKKSESSAIDTSAGHRLSPTFQIFLDNFPLNK